MATGLNVGGLSDLSPKQADMALARSPLNDQDLNLRSMKKKQEPAGVLTPETARREQQQQAGVQTQQGVTGQTAAATTPYQGIGSELGSFADRINAMTAEFLQSGVSDISAQMVEGFGPQYGEEGWEPGPMDQPLALDASQAAEAKQRRLEELRSELSPYMVDGRFAQFEDVLEEFGDTDGDGVISPEEQASINQAFNIVNQIRRLRETPAGPEREALMMQLQAQDQDGLVTGIMDAMERYENIAGAEGRGFTISGAGERVFNISDVLDMGTEDLVEEIERAAVGRESLFGQTMGTDLQRQVDISAERYRAASRERAQALDAIQDVSEEWIGQTQEQLEEQRDQINETFQTGVQGIVEDLDKIAEAEGNPEWVQRAKQWFIDTAQGSAAEGTDFASRLMDMVSGDSGLAPEIRAVFEQYLDQTLGGEPGKAGLAMMLGELGEKGYLEMPDENGAMKRVPLTANDYNEISRITQSTEMSAQEKNDAIRNLLVERMGAFGRSLQENTEVVNGMIESGEIEGSMNLFRESLVNSLQNYKGSFVDELFQAAKETGASPDQTAAAMQDEVDSYQKTLEEQAEKATNAFDKIQADATRDIQEIDELQKEVESNIAQGSEIIKNNFLNAIETAKPHYTGAIKEYFDSIGKKYDPALLDIYSQAYSYLRIMNQLQRQGKGAGGEIYGQIRSYYDGLPLGGDYFDELVTNPTNLFHLNAYQNQALINSMRIPDFKTAFQQTETYNSLDSMRDRLRSSREAATGAIKDVSVARVKANLLVDQAKKNIDSFSMDLARDIFDAAKEGEEVSLREGMVDPRDIQRLATDIDFTEDPTVREDVTGISGDRFGIPTGDRTGPELIRKVIADNRRKEELRRMREEAQREPLTLGRMVGKAGEVLVKAMLDPRMYDPTHWL